MYGETEQLEAEKATIEEQQSLVEERSVHRVHHHEYSMSGDHDVSLHRVEYDNEYENDKQKLNPTDNGNGSQKDLNKNMVHAVSFQNEPNIANLSDRNHLSKPAEDDHTTNLNSVSGKVDNTLLHTDQSS